MHDDLVRRDFTADASNQLWLGDITEHWTAEGKLYLCAIKYVHSNRIVGYSMDSRMKSRFAVAALNNAVARRDDVAGCVVHTDRGSQFRSRKFVRALHRHDMVGSMGRVGPRATTRPWRASSPCFRRTSSTGGHGPPARSSGSPSSPGSKGRTTGDGDRTPSAD